MDRLANLTNNLEKNINEMKSAMRDPGLLIDTDDRKFERMIYLFQSVGKSLVDMGNTIIIENDFRSPLNTADVFISLAEHNVIPSAIVPGLKKTMITMPRLRNYSRSELLEVIAYSIDDMKRCLTAFIKFHRAEDSRD
jgi:uncharacterized protein YutE (UPF0331/DUF86 family)